MFVRCFSSIIVSISLTFSPFISMLFPNTNSLASLLLVATPISTSISMMFLFSSIVFTSFPLNASSSSSFDRPLKFPLNNASVILIALLYDSSL